MTPNRKFLVEKLLAGYYMIPWLSRGNLTSYRLYDLKGNPIRSFHEATVKKMEKHLDPGVRLFKKDSSGRMSLNLSTVRTLHGKNMIKQLYKKQKTA